MFAASLILALTLIAIAASTGAQTAATPPAVAPPAATPQQPAGAPAPAAQPQGPRPRAVVPTAPYDFGVVGIGTDPEADFTINNAGDAPLDIGVVPLPRGLRMVRADRTIAPKGSGAIRVALDTFQAAPKNEFSVRATTNDPELPEVQFTVKAEVRAYLVLTPLAARFTFVQFGAEGSTRHVLAATDGAKFEVTGVESPLDYITPTWREAKADEREPEFEGRQWQIALTISPKAPVGPIGGYVIAKTTHPKQPRAFLQVSGFVRPLFAVTPFRLNLPAVRTPDLEKPVAVLVVKNFGADALDLTRASSDIVGLDATIVPVEAGHHWRVEVRIAAAMPGGAFKGTLRLATTSKQVPELTVPIEGNRAGTDAPAR
jgi:hypothetical protein